MIKKIQISDVSIAEEIRKQMTVVTSKDKGLIPNSGFINRQLVYRLSNYNDCVDSGIHRISDNNKEAVNGPGISYGVLCVFSSDFYILQIAASVLTGEVKTRTRTEFPAGWTSWRKIPFAN